MSNDEIAAALFIGQAPPRPTSVEPPDSMPPMPSAALFR
jgi:hypothetical protein